MNLLTREDKALIYQAVENIETGLETFSCVALDRVKGAFPSSLRGAYVDFYGMNSQEPWFLFRTTKIKEEELEHKNSRVILLLLFAEIG